MKPKDDDVELNLGQRKISRKVAEYEAENTFITPRVKVTTKLSGNHSSEFSDFICHFLSHVCVQVVCTVLKCQLDMRAQPGEHVPNVGHWALGLKCEM